jgi:hypothetical protein
VRKWQVLLLALANVSCPDCAINRLQSRGLGPSRNVADAGKCALRNEPGMVGTHGHHAIVATPIHHTRFAAKPAKARN